jgi:Zn-finger nucleic acid-binding protein
MPGLIKKANITCPECETQFRATWTDATKGQECPECGHVWAAECQDGSSPRKW